MTVEEFFKHFEDELKTNERLTSYHRVVNSKKLYKFRRAYIEQRFNFVLDQIKKPHSKIWDVGCGFGTTSILLALNGHKVHGSTLEYYYEEIQERIKYWSQFGDLSGLDIAYENMFDSYPADESLDYIVAQDTLHHLEPFKNAVGIFYKTLKPGGKIVASEENGNNIICNIKHFRERGFNRISKYYDEKLNQDIVFGNENTRSLAKWKREFARKDFIFDEESVEYIRYFLPGKYKKASVEEIIKQERELWRKSPIIRELFFFGMNFTLQKP